MWRCLILLLLACAGPCRADCIRTIDRAANIDGSAIRIEQSQCDEADTRTILVHVSPARSAAYVQRLVRTQDVQLAPTGGAALRDVDGDGVFEYEEVGGCGAGPNCEGTIFKLTRDRKALYLFFDGAYASLTHAGGFMVESARASCCAWEHHVYRIPAEPQAIQDKHMLYRIQVDGGAPAQGDGAACRIWKRTALTWRPHRPKNRELLKLCEVYGTDFVLNPPGTTSEQARPRHRRGP